MDTIFALATAEGKAGIAVVRISGAHARNAAKYLTKKDFPARGLKIANVFAAGGDLLDQALVLSFIAPESFTGEDVIELHLHGSMAVVAAVLRELAAIDGLRLAEPGEFTRRALENGKLDLTQVEGLADLIDSETEAQRQQAQKTFAGKLGELAHDWRTKLIRAAALIEATIDFADEEVPVDVTPEVFELLTDVDRELGIEVAGSVVAERVRSGFEVAIVGAPNAGKSTLLNALAGREAALTSSHAGTTRDVIEVRMDVDGLPVTLLDTAGLREADDEVEGMGIARARDRAAAADLRVFLVNPDEDLDVQINEGDILARPKADLSKGEGLGVSGLSGEGLDELTALIGQRLRGRVRSAGLATRERHRAAMERARVALQAALSALSKGPDLYDIAAEEIRTSVRALESLVGRVDVENLLDEIFSSFCLGK